MPYVMSSPFLYRHDSISRLFKPLCGLTGGLPLLCELDAAGLRDSVSCSTSLLFGDVNVLQVDTDSTCRSKSSTYSVFVLAQFYTVIVERTMTQGPGYDCSRPDVKKKDTQGSVQQSAGATGRRYLPAPASASNQEPAPSHSRHQLPMAIHAPASGTSLTGGRTAADQPQRPAPDSSVNAGLTLGHLPEVTVTASIQEPVSGTASVAGLQRSCAPSGCVIHSSPTFSVY